MESSVVSEWRLPDSARPPLIGELVERIDEAVAIARASESAVMDVGAAALDAAEQARRAAEQAERASIALLAAAPWQTSSNGVSASPVGSPELGDFSAHADRVSERLRRLAGTAVLTAA